VVLIGEATPLRLLGLVRPDVLDQGGTYAAGEVVGRELVESYGGRVCVTGRVEGRSTTRLLARLARGADPGAGVPAAPAGASNG
jgi:D-beta-D-heptose 7-phosphate kinase/D-beta-D-heptose 1-phosphate adenosyltransferase